MVYVSETGKEATEYIQTLPCPLISIETAESTHRGKQVYKAVLVPAHTLLTSQINLQQ